MTERTQIHFLSDVLVAVASLDLKVPISRELRTSRSHVTRALPSGLRFEVHVCTARPRFRGKWFTASFFCALKHLNPTFENKYDFLELFCLSIIEFYFKKRNFDDNFSAKIEVSGWMKTNMAAASYHLRILSPKYGQTGNVEPLTANRSLSYAVKWQTSILSSLIFSRWLQLTHGSAMNINDS